jgi:ribokinase
MTMTAPAQVVVIGSFNVDHVWTCQTLPNPGETLAGHYMTGPGGKGFNQAIAAARAGARTCFVCALGDDLGGQWARALATAHDIDLRDQRSTAATGTAGIYVDGEGRNSIVIGAGANAELSTSFIADQHDVIAAASVVLAQLESPLDAIHDGLRHARLDRATTILNPAPANAKATPALLSLVDVLTPNESELSALIAHHVGEHIDEDTIATLDTQHLHALWQLLPDGSVVVTLGASGCFVSHGEERLRGDTVACYRIGAERVHAIDTTGAGDAFNGALAAALAQDTTAPFSGHVRFANRYAALSTEHSGAAVAMPRLAQVKERFNAL